MRNDGNNTQRKRLTTTTTTAGDEFSKSIRRRRGRRRPSDGEKSAARDDNKNDDRKKLRRLRTSRSSSVCWTTTLLLLLLVVVLFASAFVVLVSCDDDQQQRRQQDDDDDDDDERNEATTTRHSQLIEELKIDFMSMHNDKNNDLNLALEEEPQQFAKSVVQTMMTTSSLGNRLTDLFEKTKTPECRALIAQHFGYFVNALGSEQAFPFSAENYRLANECPEPVYDDWYNLPEGMHIGHIQNRTYQPPRNTTKYIDDPSHLQLCYGILTHDDANATQRLVEALHEEGKHAFVIHVDGKETSDATYLQLKQYASNRPHVHVLNNRRRVRINWGGFSMVNATLQILQYAFAVNTDNDEEELKQPLQFHKFVHIASTSYPLASNTEIRNRIASYPLDANFLHVIMKPSRPGPASWFYFVECDDQLHRIHRLPPLQNATHGIELYTASQWFISSREFAMYLAKNESGSFVNQFMDYVSHVVVADETFFGTVLRHTKFCTKHHNDNFLHLQFDRWESDLPEGKRDQKKCMMKDPDHCGRSPTTMTLDYADILELGTDLFARKFVDSTDSRVKDIVDQWRHKREINDKTTKETQPRHEEGLDFEGHGVLIVVEDTVNSTNGPLCLGLGETGNKPKLIPCFHDAIVPTLAPGWETGGVIVEETLPHNRWSVGPCTTDGQLHRLPSAEMNVTRGNYSITGPRCLIKQMDGARQGRCLDTDSESLQPGGGTRVYPCVNRWYQFLSFGGVVDYGDDDNDNYDNGSRPIVPAKSIFSTIPSHVVRQIHNLGHEQQTAYMCLGVLGRGNHDEEHWDDYYSDDDEEEEEGGSERDYGSSGTTNNPRNIDESSTTTTTDGDNNNGNNQQQQQQQPKWEPLSGWIDHEVVTTQCTNVGGVIEWLFVPFIVEEDDADDEDVDITTAAASTATMKASSEELENKETSRGSNESNPLSTTKNGDECDDGDSECRKGNDIDNTNINGGDEEL